MLFFCFFKIVWIIIFEQFWGFKISFFFHWFCMFKFLQNSGSPQIKLQFLETVYIWVTVFWCFFCQRDHWSFFFVEQGGKSSCGVITIFFFISHIIIINASWWSAFFSYFLKSFFLFCFLFNSCSFTQKRGVKKGKKHYYLYMIVVIM